MLNHIVMWKIKKDVVDKEKVKLDIKNGLEGLFGKIEELKEIRVERFMEKYPNSPTVELIKYFLENYQNDNIQELIQNKIKKDN